MKTYIGDLVINDSGKALIEVRLDVKEEETDTLVRNITVLLTVTEFGAKLNLLQDMYAFYAITKELDDSQLVHTFIDFFDGLETEEELFY